MFSSLRMLATAVDGNQESQNFTVNYDDGSTLPITQSVSDWATPQSYTGESSVVTMDYRNQSDGTRSDGNLYIYGYSFSLDKAKTVKSVTLPDDGKVKIFSMTLVR